MVHFRGLERLVWFKSFGESGILTNMTLYRRFGPGTNFGTSLSRGVLFFVVKVFREGF
jgi:hypothetical protein